MQKLYKYIKKLVKIKKFNYINIIYIENMCYNIDILS